MAQIQRVAPVKWFVAVLWRDRNTLEAALSRLVELWGQLDVVGPDRPFHATDYYVAEMGSDLQRRLVSMSQLGPSEHLVQAKLQCNAVELQLAVDGQRSVNLDIGYLDHNKIVLGSVKYAGQKIHVGEGVYADLVARFKQGRYQPFEWTFPDFRDGRYDPELGQMRERYLEQLRESRAGQKTGG